MQSPNLPSGKVTFLFTDIEGSTRMARQYPESWERLRDRHFAILRSTIESNSGYIFEITGDAAYSSFQDAGDAVRAAAQSQLKMNSEDWGSIPFRVRMGIHSGEATIEKNGRYRGYLSLSLTQRLTSAGHGGQVLISFSVQKLIADNLPDGVTLRDMGERRVKDFLEPIHIYQLVIENFPDHFPPLNTLDIHRHNLPAQITSFIGREKEISDIRNLLTHHRLITLIGAGGIGKTRLSLRISADMLDYFPDGVWIVELASISNPDLVPSAILGALDASEYPGKSALESLKKFIRHKNMLIVLDNCEHLIDSAARTTYTVLSSAPHLKILATSREPLGVKGELTWQVSTLTLPDSKKPIEPDQLIHYESLQLFIDRASLLNQNFIADERNISSIAQICLRLDGIPLALELAAARTNTITVEQIATGLDDCFSLLTSGSRTDLPRQQTLHALIDWSHNLLLENERILFRRLAVFAGGWTEELAERICTDNRIDSRESIQLLGHLVDKSLVVLQHTEFGPRYRVLETVRQFAHEKLFISGEENDLKNRHMLAFFELAEFAEPFIRSNEQIVWLNRLEVEHDNLRAALEWSYERNVEICLGMSSSLWRFCDIRGYANEALAWLKKCLSKTVYLHSEVRALALARAGQVASNNGYPELAESYAKEAYHLGTVLADKSSQARALLILSTLELNRRNEEVGLTYMNQSLSLSREIGDHGIAASILFNYGVRARNQSLSDAITFMEKGLAEARISGDNRLITHGLKEAGLYSLMLGNIDYAKSLVEEAFPLAQEMKDQYNILACCWLRTDIMLFAEEYILAEEFASDAERFARLQDDAKSISVSLLYLGFIRWARGETLQFIELIQNALALATEGFDKFLIIELLTYLGEGYCLSKDLERARECFKKAIDILKDDIIVAGLCICLDGIAAYSLALGMYERVARLMSAREKIRESVFVLDSHPFLVRNRGNRIDQAQTELGKIAYQAAYHAGRVMTVDEIINDIMVSIK